MHSRGGALMAARAAILGCLGLVLSEDERAFFADADPWGFILFARNVETPDQIRALTASLRDAVGRDAPILIDQEGGRVARLRPPNWLDWLPPLSQMAEVAPQNRRQAMALRYRIIAAELRALGIDVNCAPMLDVATPASHEIIRNRCYGDDPDTIAEMGRAVAEGLLAGGVLPIIKHIPGHGRAGMDSHLELPVVDADRETLAATDFLPFVRLADLPMAMTAHIVYPAIDPDACATLSPKVIDVIRQDIGFDGLLMTDDLSMQALSGDFGQRTRTALAAGCDMVLHCNGEPAEMTAILAETPVLQGDALRRADAALAFRNAPEPFDFDQAVADFNALMKEDAHA
jgi:beta-N-acetylhexosaminidase